MSDAEHVRYTINQELEPYLESLQKLCKDYARGGTTVAFVADDEMLECPE